MALVPLEWGEKELVGHVLDFPSNFMDVIANLTEWNAIG